MTHPGVAAVRPTAGMAGGAGSSIVRAGAPNRAPVVPAGDDLVREGLEKLAAAFPDCLVQSGYLPCFDEVERVFTALPREPRIVASRDLLAAVGSDAELFETMRSRLSRLAAMGCDLPLLSLPDSAVVRGVGAQWDEVRLVEVHADPADGAVSAIASLSIEQRAFAGDSLPETLALSSFNPLSWRFECLAKHRVLGSGPEFADEDAIPDSDVLISLASKFLGAIYPAILDHCAGVNLRPGAGGVFFEIEGRGVQAEERAGDEDGAEQFMQIGGASRRSANIWLAG